MMEMEIKKICEPGCAKTVALHIGWDAPEWAAGMELHIPQHCGEMKDRERFLARLANLLKGEFGRQAA